MFAVAPTDKNWFDYFSQNDIGSYINFWTPTPWNIKGLKIDDRLYFLLKSPIRKIGGFGMFVEYKNLPAHDVWIEFGNRNGCQNYDDFIFRISGYLKKNSAKFGQEKMKPESHIIGNIILQKCEFWGESDYLESDLPNQVVTLKYYRNIDLIHRIDSIEDFVLIIGQKDKKMTTASGRIGQGSFSSEIFSVYKDKCCICREDCVDILHAGHIQPYVNRESHHVQNGLLLRIDIHLLFDKNLLFIDSNYIVHVSHLVKSQYYQSLNGVKINLPANKYEWPSQKALELRRNAFRGVVK